MRKHVLLFGFDEEFAQWAAQRIPWMPYRPGVARAIGVAEGVDAGASVLAVVLYHNYYPPVTIDGREWYNTVEMSIAATSPRWAVRGTIIDLLNVAFKDYKVRKVRLVCPFTNKRAIRFAEGIGFTLESTLRHEFAKNVHACVLGLLRHEFERPDFLKRKKRPPKPRKQANGQEFRIGATAA